MTPLTKLKPNVLFLMSDQHNAGSMGCAGHPVVKTPSLDSIARQGVRFTRAYCNNPVCAPSRVSFHTGQYPHTHRILGNDDFELDDCNPATLGAVFRRQGYQTAVIGKAHMVRKWDEEGFEHIRYCDLCDADRRDPTTHHYFKYLLDHGLADQYEDGTLPPGHPARREQRRQRESLKRADLDAEYVDAFARRIRELFPHCPAGKECGIAEHACRKYSGRVGRSAAAKALDEEAVTLAVRAHLRHAHANYDELLMEGWERFDAREAVRHKVAALESSWRTGVSESPG